MRASWTGTIGFGLVNLDVGACPAVSANDVTFKQYHWGDLTQEQTSKGEKPKLNPVGRQDYDKVTGEIIQYADIVRGYEASNGAIVEVSDDELASMAPAGGKRIEIEGFVDLESVMGDFLFFAKHEYAAPRKGSEKAYGLLVQALQQTGKVGVARTVRRGKESVVLVRAYDGALVLTFLHWADDVRTVGALDLPQVEVKDAEVAMAVALVQTLSTEWKPDTFEDQHRAKVVAMLEAKAEGKAPELPAKSAEADKASDLMASLKASVEALAGKK